jgi:Tol biopolymer transport system component
VGAHFEGAWTRDGRNLFNRAGPAPQVVFRFSLEKRERRTLYVAASGEDLNQENLALSPDESTLAFQVRHTMEKSASLMLVPADGGVPRTLLKIHSPDQFAYGAFAWLRDGQSLLAVRSRGDASEVWRVPVDGREPARLDYPKMMIRALRVSPDGTKIAFHSGQQQSELWVMEGIR